MYFYVVLVTVPTHTAEAIGETFWQAGAQGLETVAETDATVALRAYFLEAPPADELLAALKQTLAAFDDNEWRLQDVAFERHPYEDWLAKWKQDWVIQPVGQQWLVVPPWRQADVEARPEWKNRLCLVIEPGMAFGTGTHATTQACLRLLEQLPTPPQQVLDVGTGTGILAIAVAKRFPDAVCTACDIDPTAVAVAATNARANGVSGRVRTDIGSIMTYPDGNFDLVLANLTAEVITSLASDLARVLRPHGYLIAAGVLCEQQAQVATAIADAGLDIQSTQTDGEWWSALARRTPRE